MQLAADRLSSEGLLRQTTLPAASQNKLKMTINR
jgi:hypothetical protein